MPLHIIAGIFLAIVAVAAAGAAISWVIENFAKNAAVRATARGFRKFFVTILRTIGDVVILAAKSANGLSFFSETISYDEYDGELDINEEYEYSFEASDNDDEEEDDY